MPVQVFPDVLDCELEVARVESGVPAANWTNYPFPPVVGTGQSGPQSIRTVVLENELLRVTVAVDLGGRILEVLDKRTGTELLPKVNALTLAGLATTGVQWAVGPDVRPTATGPMHWMMQEPEDDDDAGELRLFELIPGAHLSLAVTLTLQPEEAVLAWEMRVHNRGFRSLEIWPGLRFPGETSLDSKRRAGFAVVDEDCAFDQPYQRHQMLGPRESAVLRAKLVAVSGTSELSEVNLAGSIHLQADQVFVQLSWPPEDAELHLQARSHQAFKSPLQLDQSLTARIPLTGDVANPARVIVTAGGQPILGATPESRPLSPNRKPALQPAIQTPETEEELSIATREAGLRGAAYARLGQLAAAAENWPLAAERFEAALMFNGDDPLAWADRALCDRHLAPDEQSQALLNAHFLSPMEPMLRAAAFLAQPGGFSADPHPLVAPLAEDPEALIDVAVRLLELGQWVDAGRWIDEALRHRPLALLKILQAYLLQFRSNMAAEAAGLVRDLETLPIEPPYPWHPTVLSALKELSDKFPDSPALQKWVKKEF
ncbi:MAG: DUF5107 domain-containing protein [Chthonomonas sp.]|nr:DUF5107 domain-containing protein [Chthonomonas sp.]